MPSFIKHAALAMAIVALLLSVMTIQSDARAVSHPDIQNYITSTMNDQRRMLRRGPLRWVKGLSESADAVSLDECNNPGSAARRPNFSVGTTVYTSASPAGNPGAEMIRVIRRWTAEKSRSYTLMMTPDTIYVGCALNRCTRSGETVGVFACTYARGK